MTTTALVSPADPTPADAASWAADLQTLLDHLGRHFARSETRQHLRAYLTGLLSPLERKNGWQLAEQAGAATPYGLQHLLDRATRQMGRRCRARRSAGLCAHASGPRQRCAGHR